MKEITKKMPFETIAKVLKENDIKDKGFDIDRVSSHTNISSLNYFIEKLDRFKESN